MKDQHLTDAEIQLYVLQNNNCSKHITEHIQHCEICKVNALLYNALVDGINQQEKPVFDFSLVDLVMEQLPKEEPAMYNEKWFYYFIASLIVVPAFIIFYLFGNNLFNLLSGITPILIALSLTTVTCVFTFLCIDMYRKHQTQMKALLLH